MPQKLTYSQEQFTLGLFNGLDQTASFREAYDTSTWLSKTVHEKASRLAAMGKIQARLLELREPGTTEATIVVNKVSAILLNIAEHSLKPSDRVAAADKLLKLHGAYRDSSRDREQKVQVTHVTVVLTSGSETREVEPRGQVLEALGSTVPDDNNLKDDEGWEEKR